MADKELMNDRYKDIPGGLLCLKCGSFIPALATSTHYAWEIHDRFHLNLNAVADNATWGGMNRPIGGR